jgi:hypothetical protein
MHSEASDDRQRNTASFEKAGHAVEGTREIHWSLRPQDSTRGRRAWRSPAGTATPAAASKNWRVVDRSLVKTVRPYVGHYQIEGVAGPC